MLELPFLPLCADNWRNRRRQLLYHPRENWRWPLVSSVFLDRFRDNPNTPLKRALILSLICFSDHSVENEIFSTRPAWANLVQVSSLGIINIDVSGGKGKHTTSFVYVLTYLWFKYLNWVLLHWGQDRRGAYCKQAKIFFKLSRNRLCYMIKELHKRL